MVKVMNLIALGPITIDFEIVVFLLPLLTPLLLVTTKSLPTNPSDLAYKLVSFSAQKPYYFQNIYLSLPADWLIS